MEAWLLGDMEAVGMAYPDCRKTAVKNYVQDGICDTWEVLANVVYSGGLARLMKNAGKSYSEIGKVKAEWADQIGAQLQLEQNASPSFQFFISELKRRIEME